MVWLKPRLPQKSWPISLVRDERWIRNNISNYIAILLGELWIIQITSTNIRLPYLISTLLFFRNTTFISFSSMTTSPYKYDWVSTGFSWWLISAAFPLPLVWWWLMLRCDSNFPVSRIWRLHTFSRFAWCKRRYYAILLLLLMKKFLNQTWDTVLFASVLNLTTAIPQKAPVLFSLRRKILKNSGRLERTRRTTTPSEGFEIR